MRAWWKAVLFFAFLLMMSVGKVFAYRPFTTEDALILNPGQIEVEIGHDAIDHGDRKRTFSGFYSFNLGLPARSEVNLAAPVIYDLQDKMKTVGEGEEDDIRARGIGDLQFLGKIRVLDESHWLPTFSPVGIIVFPTGDAGQGLGNPKTNYQILGAFTKSVRKDLTLHANLGYVFFNDGADQFIARSGIDYKAASYLNLIADLDSSFDFKSNARCGVLTGFILNFNPRMSFDLGVRFGLTPEDDPYRITTGLTFLI